MLYLRRLHHGRVVGYVRGEVSFSFVDGSVVQLFRRIPETGFDGRAVRRQKASYSINNSTCLARPRP